MRSHPAEFTFTYRHESSECRLAARTSGTDQRLTFYFAVSGSGRTLGRYDGLKLGMFLSAERIHREDLIAPRELAGEIIDEFYSHGEPRRRKPIGENMELLSRSLETWITQSRSRSNSDSRSHP